MINLEKVIFSNYKIGEIFNLDNAKYYNFLGWMFFIHAVIAKPISEGLMVLAVTLANPVGERYISISFGTPNLASIFYGIIVLVVSWVMLEAAKIKEEQSLII